MSTTRILDCLEQTACVITRRGRNVGKRAIQGGVFGFALGSVVGAFSLINSVTANCGAMEKKLAEYPACKFNHDCSSRSLNCSDSNMNISVKQAVDKAGSDAVNDRLVFLASFALPISAVGGMVLGMAVGAWDGFVEELPAAPKSAIELEEEIELEEGEKTKNKDGVKYQSLGISRSS